MGVTAHRTKEHTMATITIFESVTLDGVMQAPVAPTRTPAAASRTAAGRRLRRRGVDAVRRRGACRAPVACCSAGAPTRTCSASGPPHRSPTRSPTYWSNSPKYVVSRSADTTLAYPNSTLLAGDAVETVGALKRQVADDLTILGSGELVRALHAGGLIDRYILQIHPIVLGSGRRLFGEADRIEPRRWSARSRPRPVS